MNVMLYEYVTTGAERRSPAGTAPRCSPFGAWRWKPTLFIMTRCAYAEIKSDIPAVAVRRPAQEANLFPRLKVTHRVSNPVRSNGWSVF